MTDAGTRAVDQASGGRAIHATAVLVGESGIVIRGRSGRARAASRWHSSRARGRNGLFARLVGDDRVYVALRNDG